MDSPRRQNFFSIYGTENTFSTSAKKMNLSLMRPGRMTNPHFNGHLPKQNFFFFFFPRGEKGIFTEAMQLHSTYRCGWLFFPLYLTRMRINQKENPYSAYLFHCFGVYKSVINANTLLKISPPCSAIWMMFLFKGILHWKVKLWVLCGVVYNNAVNSSPQVSWTISTDQHKHNKLILNIPEVTFTDELVAWYAIAFFT